MTVISIITEDVTLAKVIDSELVGVDHELIVNNWHDGFNQASGKFVCFLEQDADFRGGLFVRGLLDILIKPGYSKLAMISPAVEILETNKIIFDFTLTDDDKRRKTFAAQDVPRSSSPYLARSGYLPGAIIRASALEDFKHVLKEKTTPLQKSIDFSVLLWNSGKQLHIDPKMVYQIDRLQLQFRKAQIDPTKEALQIWKRESV